MSSCGPGRAVALIGSSDSASNTAPKAAEGFESCPTKRIQRRRAPCATSGHSRELPLDLSIHGALEAHEQLLI